MRNLNQGFAINTAKIVDAPLAKMANAIAPTVRINPQLKINRVQQKSINNAATLDGTPIQYSEFKTVYDKALALISQFQLLSDYQKTLPTNVSDLQTFYTNLKYYVNGAYVPPTLLYSFLSDFARKRPVTTLQSANSVNPTKINIDNLGSYPRYVYEIKNIVDAVNQAFLTQYYQRDAQARASIIKQINDYNSSMSFCYSQFIAKFQVVLKVNNITNVASMDKITKLKDKITAYSWVNLYAGANSFHIQLPLLKSKINTTLTQLQLPRTPFTLQLNDMKGSYTKILNFEQSFQFVDYTQTEGQTVINGAGSGPQVLQNVNQVFDHYVQIQAKNAEIQSIKLDATGQLLINKIAYSSMFLYKDQRVLTTSSPPTQVEKVYTLYGSNTSATAFTTTSDATSVDATKYQGRIVLRPQDTIFTQTQFNDILSRQIFDYDTRVYLLETQLNALQTQQTVESFLAQEAIIAKIEEELTQYLTYLTLIKQQISNYIYSYLKQESDTYQTFIEDFLDACKIMQQYFFYEVKHYLLFQETILRNEFVNKQQYFTDRQGQSNVLIQNAFFFLCDFVLPSDIENNTINLYEKYLTRYDTYDYLDTIDNTGRTVAAAGVNPYALPPWQYEPVTYDRDLKSLIFLLRRKPVLEYGPDGLRVLLQPDANIDRPKDFVDSTGTNYYNIETYRFLFGILVLNYVALGDTSVVDYANIATTKDTQIQNTISYFNLILPAITTRVTTDYNTFSNYLTNQKYYYYENMTYNPSYPLYGGMAGTGTPLPTNQFDQTFLQGRLAFYQNMWDTIQTLQTKFDTVYSGPAEVSNQLIRPAIINLDFELNYYTYYSGTQFTTQQVQNAIGQYSLDNNFARYSQQLQRYKTIQGNLLSTSSGLSQLKDKGMIYVAYQIMQLYNLACPMQRQGVFDKNMQLPQPLTTLNEGLIYTSEYTVARSNDGSVTPNYIALPYSTYNLYVSIRQYEQFPFYYLVFDNAMITANFVKYFKPSSMATTMTQFFKDLDYVTQLSYVNYGFSYVGLLVNVVQLGLIYDRPQSDTRITIDVYDKDIGALTLAEGLSSQQKLLLGLGTNVSQTISTSQINSSGSATASANEIWSYFLSLNQKTINYPTRIVAIQQLLRALYYMVALTEGITLDSFMSHIEQILIDVNVNVNENFIKVNGDGVSTIVNNLASLAKIEDVVSRQERARKHEYFIESGRMQENTIKQFKETTVNPFYQTYNSRDFFTNIVQPARATLISNVNVIGSSASATSESANTVTSQINYVSEQLRLNNWLLSDTTSRDFTIKEIQLIFKLYDLVKKLMDEQVKEQRIQTATLRQVLNDIYCKGLLSFDVYAQKLYLMHDLLYVPAITSDEGSQTFISIYKAKRDEIQAQLNDIVASQAYIDYLAALPQLTTEEKGTLRYQALAQIKSIIDSKNLILAKWAIIDTPYTESDIDYYIGEAKRFFTDFNTSDVTAYLASSKGDELSAYELDLLTSLNILGFVTPIVKDLEDFLCGAPSLFSLQQYGDILSQSSSALYACSQSISLFKDLRAYFSSNTNVEDIGATPLYTPLCLDIFNVSNKDSVSLNLDFAYDQLFDYADTQLRITSTTTLANYGYRVIDRFDLLKRIDYRQLISRSFTPYPYSSVTTPLGDWWNNIVLLNGKNVSYRDLDLIRVIDVDNTVNQLIIRLLLPQSIGQQQESINVINYANTPNTGGDITPIREYPLNQTDLASLRSSFFVMGNVGTNTSLDNKPIWQTFLKLAKQSTITAQDLAGLPNQSALLSYLVWYKKIGVNSLGTAIYETHPIITELLTYYQSLTANEKSRYSLLLNGAFSADNNIPQQLRTFQMSHEVLNRIQNIQQMRQYSQLFTNYATDNTQQNHWLMQDALQLFDTYVRVNQLNTLYQNFFFGNGLYLFNKRFMDEVSDMNYILRLSNNSVFTQGIVDNVKGNTSLIPYELFSSKMNIIGLLQYQNQLYLRQKASTTGGAGNNSDDNVVYAAYKDCLTGAQSTLFVNRMISKVLLGQSASVVNEIKIKTKDDSDGNEVIDPVLSLM